MTRMAPNEAGISVDDPRSTESPADAPARVLSLLEDAAAFAVDGDMETVDRILSEVTELVRHAAPLSPSEAWNAVRQRHERLQREIDAAGERIRAELGQAGGGRRAAHRYGQLIPPPTYSDDEKVG
jgi:hypothetical protein